MPVQVKSSEEYQSILEKNELVVVDFTAAWCGPCKMVAPKFEEMSKEYTKATFVKLDVDEVQAVAEAAGIRAMPTFHIYKNKEKVVEIVGANIGKLEEELIKAVM